MKTPDGPPYDATVEEQLFAAQQERMKGQFNDAIHRLASLAVYLPARSPHRTRVILDRIITLYVSGETRLALEASERFLQESGPYVRTDAGPVLILAFCHSRLGNLDYAAELFKKAAQSPATGTFAGFRCAPFIGLATIALVRNKDPLIEENLELAEHYIQTEPPGPFAAWFKVDIGSIKQVCGDTAGAEDDYEEALRIAGTCYFAGEIRALSRLLELYTWQARVAEIPELKERLGVLRERSTSHFLNWEADISLGRALRLEGKPEEALVRFELAADCAKRMEYPFAIAKACQERAIAHLMIGQLDPANKALAQADSVVGGKWETLFGVLMAEIIKVFRLCAEALAAGNVEKANEAWGILVENKKYFDRMGAGLLVPSYRIARFGAACYIAHTDCDIAERKSHRRRIRRELKKFLETVRECGCPEFARHVYNYVPFIKEYVEDFDEKVAMLLPGGPPVSSNE